MIAVAILSVYVALGSIFAIAVVIKRRAVAGLGGLSSFFLMLVFWPFLLPTALLSEADLTRAVAIAGPRRRIAEVGIHVRDAWIKSGPVEPRERAVVEGFLTRLEERSKKLDELAAALEAAPPSIRPRLEMLRGELEREIAEGLTLLEEMTAQLTLLRFTGLTERETPGADRDLVEGLLARIEAMANISV
jgi:hypothetical protein